MLSAWWLHHMDGLGKYVILPGSIAHILMIPKNLMTLSYTYSKRRLKNPPNISCKIAHIGQLIAWLSSILSWTPAIRGRDRSLLRPILTKAFAGTKNQEVPTVFETSTRYTLWDSGCTHSINPYFELYTEYKHLEQEDDT